MADGASQAPIVVGVDDSLGSRAALSWAADEAHRRAVPLLVVHAWQSMHHTHVDDYTLGRLTTAFQSRGDAVVARALAVVRAAQPSVPARGRLVKGDPSVVLLEAAHEAGLVVVGSRGLGGFTGLLLGSVGMHLVAHAECPVAVVRGSLHRSGPVTAGVDGSESTEAVLAAGFEAAALRHSPLVVVCATHPDAPERDTALDDLVERWARKYPDVAVSVGRPAAHPAEALVGASRSAQLLVIGWRGGGGFAGMSLGSIAHAIVQHAHCPVVVCRDRALHPGPAPV